MRVHGRQGAKSLTILYRKLKKKTGSPTTSMYIMTKVMYGIFATYFSAKDPRERSFKSAFYVLYGNMLEPF